MRILVTGAGGAAALSFMKAVADDGHEIIAADMDPLACGLYLTKPANRLLVPDATAPHFIEALLAACKRLRVDVLVPTVDTELPLVARALSRFETLGTRVMVSPEDALVTCLDKWKLYLACIAASLPVPKTMLLESMHTLPIAGPLRHCDWQSIIVKPRRGSGGRGVREVNSAVELSRLRRQPGLIAQAFLPGDEYSVDVLSDKAGVPLIAVPRLRLKVDSGVAVAGRTVRAPKVAEIARRVVAKLGLTYVTNVQIRIDVAGRPRILEINPRLPGTMPLTVAAGVNMPRLSLAILMDQPIPENLSFEEVGLVRQWQEYVVSPEEMAALQRKQALSQVDWLAAPRAMYVGA